MVSPLKDDGEPVVTRFGVLDMQVCVPNEWTDQQVIEFANLKNECGITRGWYIRRQDHPALVGMDERTKCSKREGFVHIMLDC